MKGQRRVGQSQSPGLPHLSGLPSFYTNMKGPVYMSVTWPQVLPFLDQIKSPMYEIWAHGDTPPPCGAGLQLEEPVVLSGKIKSFLPKYGGTFHFRIKLLGFAGGSDGNDGSDAYKARDPG